MSLHLPSEDELREIARSETSLQRAAMAREVLRQSDEIADCHKRARAMAFDMDRIRSLVPGSVGTTFDLVHAELDRLRAGLAKASAEVQRLEGERVGAKRAWEQAWSDKGERDGPIIVCDKDGKPIVCNEPPPKFTPEQVRDCVTEQPADVLGEAFRRSVLLAKPGTGLPLGDRDGCLIGESVDAAKFRHLHSAVSGLAQVVERIARQQGGGK